MNVDPEEAFARIVEDAGGHAQRFAIDASLVKIQRRCKRAATQHLGDWIALLDEALQVILQLHEMLDQQQMAHPDGHRAAVLMGLARAAACLAGIRRLVIDGLEEIARPIGRSYLETLDLTLACMVDEDFARRFIGPDMSYDANEFWKKEIAHGRLAQRLRTKLDSIGVPEDQIDSYLSEQLSIKSELSGSVHSAMRSAFHSALVPSLVHEGRYSTQFLGHHSELSPFLVFWVAARAHSLAEVVMTIVLKQLDVASLAFLTENPRKGVGFFGAFFTLQDIMLDLELDLSARHDRIAARRSALERG